jgi:hypothetical protein
MCTGVAKHISEIGQSGDQGGKNTKPAFHSCPKV